MLRQFFDASFRGVESFLRLLADFFHLARTPDANTLSRVNRTQRFTILLRRFQTWVLDQVPIRNSVVAVDATGYGNQKAPWSETDYGFRATKPWLKVHAAVEIPTLLYVSTVITRGSVHDSQMFRTVLDNLHDHVRPMRTLADAAYAGDACLRAAQEHGATPLHRFRKDARHFAVPTTPLQKMVNFAKHWPNRFAALTGQRALVETAFHCTKQRFGHQLRCRHPTARLNEILAKQVAHNARILLMRSSCGLTTF
ncbi:MAG: transposase [Halobacteriales archaeon]|nr:transposase [Halobacteriales archaeon]